MAVYSNITIDQGTDFSSAIDVTDADGDADIPLRVKLEKHIHLVQPLI